MQAVYRAAKYPIGVPDDVDSCGRQYPVVRYARAIGTPRGRRPLACMTGYIDRNRDIQDVSASDGLAERVKILRELLHDVRVLEVVYFHCSDDPVEQRGGAIPSLAETDERRKVPKWNLSPVSKRRAQFRIRLHEILTDTADMRSGSDRTHGSV